MITKRLSNKTLPVLLSIHRLDGIPTRRTLKDSTVTLDSEYLHGAWTARCGALTVPTLKHDLVGGRICGLHIRSKCPTYRVTSKFVVTRNARVISCVHRPEFSRR
jgi:hypothetical protein